MSELRQIRRPDDPRRANHGPKPGKSTYSAPPGYLKGRLNDGSPMEAEVRARMEGAFGTDFSAVRIHTDPPAREFTSRLSATAATLGDDIAFSPGSYRPGTPLGDALLAHELAHVIQQRGAGEGTPQGLSAESGSALEAEADRGATGVVAKLWGGATRLGHALLPTMRSGLRVQRCKKAETPAWSEADWTKHAAALRKAAAGTISDEQEVLFIAAFNDARRGLDLPLIEGAVEKYPGDNSVRPNRIYFDKNFTATPAVTQAVYGYGRMKSITYSPKASREGSVIVLGPKAILEGRAYTQSVIRHEYVHLEQNKAIIDNGTARLSRPDSEVPAYTEQFRHINALTSNELRHGLLYPLLGYYVNASQTVRDQADRDIVAHIAANLPKGPRTGAEVPADLRKVLGDLRAGSIPGVPSAKAPIGEKFLNHLIGRLSTTGGGAPAPGGGGRR